MSLKTRIAQDFQVFLNSDEFAEEVTYTPKGGSAKTVKAVVAREQTDSDPIDRNRVLRNDAEVWIPNDATNGITAPKRDDLIAFPKVFNGATVNWKVNVVVSGDNGVWHLVVGR